MAVDDTAEYQAAEDKQTAAHSLALLPLLPHCTRPVTFHAVAHDVRVGSHPEPPSAQCQTAGRYFTNHQLAFLPEDANHESGFSHPLAL